MIRKNNRKVAFVTGGTGFVGSNLIYRLLSEDMEVHILARKDSAFWRIGDVKKDLKIQIGDIADFPGLLRIMKRVKPDYIFHLANAGLSGTQIGSDDEQVRVNLIGTMNMVKAAREVGCLAFINSGSSAEYGAKTKPMRETDICTPESVYAVTKLAATSYASFFAKKNNFPLVTLRIFSPFGPRDDKNRLISAVSLHCLNNTAPSLANPKAVRDYIYVEDLVDLYLVVAKKIKKLSPGMILNAGVGRQKTANHAVDIIARATKTKAKIIWGKAAQRGWESVMWQADMSRVKKLLGWQTKYTFEQGIEKTVDWFRENKVFYK